MGISWWIVIIMWGAAAIISMDQTLAQMEPRKIEKTWKKIMAVIIFIIVAPMSLVINAVEIILDSFFDGDDDGGSKHV